MRKTDAFRRAAALLAALSITVSLAAPAFAGTYYIDKGNITVIKNSDGTQTIKHGDKEETEKEGEEIIITTSNEATTTLESDLEGPAAEDSDFGPVVEDNYQPAAPAQPEDADQQESADRQKDADQQEDADQQKDADQQESADQQAQPLQAAPAPAASTPDFWHNTITVINIFTDTVLNLTLKNVKIDVSDADGKAALSVQGDGNVTIELDGNNELKSGNLKAGLEKNTSEGTLTLKDDKEAGSGSLTAEGGGWAAGIGGSDGKGTNNIIISGGTVTAEGGNYGAGIGGGYGGVGDHITIGGGAVTAEGGENGAGIGGGYWGRGRNITVSGAAQVTAVAGKSDEDNFSGFGATIGDGYNGGDTRDDDGNLISYGSGKEVQADISGLTTTGYIRHMIYNEDGSVKQEWWEYGHLQPDPDGPNAPAEESNEVDLGTPVLHVETLEGDLLPFDARKQGSTLRVTTDNLSARLHGTRQALEALREQGVEQIQFVTSFKTTTLSVEELLAEGGSWFALEHNGLVSRQLSAAQAESLKCRMR